MTLREASTQGEYRVWDDARLDQARTELFDPAWWQSHDALLGQAEGRGAAHILRGLDGLPWVLRHNRRGGALAQLNPDRFLYTGMARARPLCELRLLADLHAQGLPVPAPVAARVHSFLGFYQGDLITQQIPHTMPLADRLAEAALPATVWQDLGSVIARFHLHGVWHADLNARNVLIDTSDVFYLIDFDKARQRASGRWREANLKRLRRSLDKFGSASMTFNFLDADWVALRGGYASVFAAGL